MTSVADDLHGYLEAAARATPDAIAVEEAGDAKRSYRELDQLSDRVRDRLVATGVRPGDRVGLCLPKSIDTLAILYGILKCGAAYVPTDATAPMARAGLILADCGVRAAFVETSLHDELARHMHEHHPHVHVVARAIDRWHVYELWSVGCRDIIRETYDSSIRAARLIRARCCSHGSTRDPGDAGR